MRKTDMFNFAYKFLPKLSWIVALFIGVAVYGLIVAGTAFIILNDEKSLPSELQILGENINGATIVQLADIPEIIDISPTINATTTLKYGDYSGEFDVAGIESTYIQELVSNGAVFPENTAMPYYVMNTAALKTLLNSLATDSNYIYDEQQEGRRSQTKVGDIDWFSGEVETGVEIPVTGRICGIIEDESEIPMVFLSINSAKQLFSRQYTGGVARIISSGSEEDAIKAIAPLGLSVQNTNTEQIARWQARESEMTYLFLSSLCLLICMGFIVYMRREMSKKPEEISVMRICGVGENTIKNILRLSVCYQVVLGVIIGIILALCVPAFISPEEAESVFNLQ